LFSIHKNSAVAAAFTLLDAGFVKKVTTILDVGCASIASSAGENNLSKNDDLL
jgi:hypothetical protein